MYSTSGNATGNEANLYAASQQGWHQQARATIYPGDIRSPWKSAHGFPMTMARLAAGQRLELNCREDEILDYMEQMNRLLGSPESLNQGCLMLRKLGRATLQKLIYLMGLQERSLTDSEIPDLIARIEEILSDSTGQSRADRLACILSPDNPLQEITGLSGMLIRLQRLTATLKSVKETGFHVVVIDKQRQPLRPALEARRCEPILIDGEPSGMCAGFLLPANHHLTLWRYLVVRKDRGQAAVWN